MHSGVRATGCGGSPGRARQSGESLLEDQLNRPPFGLPLPATEVGAIELDDQEKCALH